jgi:hypothetical protein
MSMKHRCINKIKHNAMIPFIVSIINNYHRNYTLQNTEIVQVHHYSKSSSPCRIWLLLTNYAQVSEVRDTVVVAVGVPVPLLVMGDNWGRCSDGWTWLCIWCQCWVATWVGICQDSVTWRSRTHPSGTAGKSRQAGTPSPPRSTGWTRYGSSGRSAIPRWPVDIIPVSTRWPAGLLEVQDTYIINGWMTSRFFSSMLLGVLSRGCNFVVDHLFLTTNPWSNIDRILDEFTYIIE